MMKKKIPLNVILLGLVSLFNDLAAEMIYPIVPIFLSTILHTSIPIIGIIEGTAEATASITKYFFGTASDYFRKRKPFVIAGYFFGSISKLLIGLAYAWPLVLTARVVDRIGKGLRTAPRDSILLENTDQHNKGFIFGFHRAMDSMGAVLGPLLALFFLALLKDNMRLVFFIAFIPSIISVLLLAFFVKEKQYVQKTGGKRMFTKIQWKQLHPQLKIFFLISFLFAIGNSSDAFLLLNAKRLGLTTTLVVFVYVLYNLSQTIFATPAGSFADKIGARKVFLYGLAIFSLVYLGFGLTSTSLWLWLLFPLYGIYIAFTDGVSKAYVSEFITQETSGTFFGLYYTLTTIGNFLASVIGGLLWNRLHPSSTFFYGSIMAALSLIIFILTQQKYASKNS